MAYQVAFVQETAGTHGAVAASWKMRLERPGETFACDLVSFEPLRPILYTTLRRLMNEAHVTSVDTLSGWARQTCRATLSHLLGRPPDRKGLFDAEWTFRLHENFCAHLLDLAFDAFTRSDWAQQCPCPTDVMVTPAPAMTRASSPSEPSAKQVRSKSPIEAIFAALGFVRAAPVEEDVVFQLRDLFRVAPDASLALTLSLSTEEHGETVLGDVVALPPLEQLTSNAIDRLVAPFVPNVPALNVCVSGEPHSLDASIMGQLGAQHSARPVVRVTEALAGVPLDSLLGEPSHRPLLASLTLDDWKSVVAQLVMTHYNLIAQA
jgi:hypothetical protein